MIIARIILFIAYLSLFFSPLWILWETWGLITGLILWLVVLVFLTYNAKKRIGARLGTVPLKPTDHPVFFVLLKEHARRLDLPIPSVVRLRTEAPNAAVFGLSKNGAEILVTDGLLKLLNREELSALIARLLTVVWHRDMVLSTWLSQFLFFLDLLARQKHARRAYTPNRNVSFNTFLRQVILYPLALFPVSLLSGHRDESELDKHSVMVTRNALTLTEAYRKIEAALPRMTFHVPFFARHLFLVVPDAEDPLVGTLFKQDSLKTRIRILNPLKN